MVVACYNRKKLTKYVLLLFSFVFLCMMTEGVWFLLLIPFLLFALVCRKNDSLLFLIMIAVSSMSLSAFFMPKSMIMVIAQKCVMILASICLLVQLFGRAHSKMLKPLLLLLPYLIFMTISSQVWWSPLISNLKRRSCRASSARPPPWRCPSWSMTGSRETSRTAGSSRTCRRTGWRQESAWRGKSRCCC